MTFLITTTLVEGTVMNIMKSTRTTYKIIKFFFVRIYKCLVSLKHITVEYARLFIVSIDVNLTKNFVFGENVRSLYNLYRIYILNLSYQFNIL